LAHDRRDREDEPFAPFERWLRWPRERTAGRDDDAATATRDGVPSLRAVLLKGRIPRFVF
jgi:pyridoxine/pyridoxamine 5'-phosphate oxidase